MTVHRLTNERWGFTTNCFVCEPRNDEGLRIPFHHDDERDIVTAEFELSDAFSGTPSYVHGGISLAVLDEAQSWATIACAGKFAVTQETTSRFEKPVRVGKPYRIEAEVVSVDDNRISTAARILDRHDDVCVESTATFVVLGAATAADAIGAELSAEEQTFLGD